MFNDEDPFAFKKMCEFSTVDGFVEITEGLAEMIKFLANEPSVGLFYIQQHTQNAAPNLMKSKNKLEEKSREMSLHTEDLEDSITMVRSMKECGFPIADEMIRDIKRSLAVMSTKQSKRGLTNSPSSNPAMWARSRTTGEGSAAAAGYFSDVFRSAKQRATSFKWPPLDSIEPNQTKGETTSSYPKPTSLVAATSNSSKSEAKVENSHEDLHVDKSLSYDELLSLSENYEEFKVHKEAKLEEWLGGTDDEDLREVRGHRNTLLA